MSTEERFKEYLDSKFPVDDKRTRSAIIHQSYGERIVRHLKVAMSESPEVCQFSSTEAISQHCYTISASNLVQRFFKGLGIHLHLLVM